MTRSAVILRTAGLLLVSNCFMTAAWYGHLRFKHASFISAIALSWMLALPEYAFQVPANRLGFGTLDAYQLKILQECITLVVFILFAWLYLGESPQPKYVLSFVFVLAAVVTAFK